MQDGKGMKTRAEHTGEPMFDSRRSPLVEKVGNYLVLVWNPFRFCYSVSKSCNGHSVSGLWVGVKPVLHRQCLLQRLTENDITPKVMRNNNRTIMNRQ